MDPLAVETQVLENKLQKNEQRKKIMTTTTHLVHLRLCAAPRRERSAPCCGSPGEASTAPQLARRGQHRAAARLGHLRSTTCREKPLPQQLVGVGSSRGGSSPGRLPRLAVSPMVCSERRCRCSLGLQTASMPPIDGGADLAPPVPTDGSLLGQVSLAPWTWW